MKKRTYLIRVAALLLALLTVAATGSFGILAAEEAEDAHGLASVTLDENALYNGIVLPDNWKYKPKALDGNPPKIPYLLSKEEGGYAPDVINIDAGRQLFVDDFLIDSTTLETVYHQAKTQDAPIFVGDQPWEYDSAVLTSGGVWYDMEEKLYKMWYQSGFVGKMSYATSKDGIHWERQMKTGDNTVLGLTTIASSSVWLDYDAPESERYKMMLRQSNSVVGYAGKARLYVSSNGINWVAAKDENGAVVSTGRMEDRSTFFYDALNDQWRFSIRFNETAGWGTKYNDLTARVRYLHSGDTWLEAAQWDAGWIPRFSNEPADNVPHFWLKTDGKDPKDPNTEGNKIPELYNVDAIAYESIMVGLQTIWYGPDLDVTNETNEPKINEIQASFSRDGYYYDRPVRGVGEGNALIPASRTPYEWDFGYLSTATGGIVVLDEEIRIYYSAISGYYEVGGGLMKDQYKGGAVGYATLRRDGFASMNGSGELLTNPLTVTKDVKHLFVNAKADSLKAEVLDTEGNVVEGFSADDCVAFSGDSCCTMLTWKGGEDLAFLQGKGFRIRFVMENGELYSFWLSESAEGNSGGEAGAGYAGSKEWKTVDQLKAEAAEKDDPANGDSDSTNATPEPAKKKGCFSAVSPATILLPALAAAAVVRRRKRKQTADGSYR